MKLFIWDFHGTLEKENEFAVLEISNLILEEYGFTERFSEAQCRDLYGKKWFEYFKLLLPNESNDKHFELQEACFGVSDSHPKIIAKYIKPVDHALEVLELINQKHDQILVSNTRKTSLKIFMSSIGISKYFPEGKALATDSHTNNNTKLDILKKFLKNNNYEEIIMIGDSPGDIECGKAINALTFLYAHPGHEFKKCEPHHKINDLREVLKIL